MIRKSHDALSGLFFAGLGGVYLWKTLTELEIGTAFSMGAGYLPLLVSSGLVLVGGLIILRSLRGAAEQNLFAVLPWRAILWVCAAMLAFAFLLRPAGLFPAVMAASLLSGMARPQTARGRVAVALGVAAFCTAVFCGIVGLPVAVLGSWRL